MWLAQHVLMLCCQRHVFTVVSHIWFERSDSRSPRDVHKYAGCFFCNGSSSKQMSNIKKISIKTWNLTMNTKKLCKKTICNYLNRFHLWGINIETRATHRTQLQSMTANKQNIEIALCTAKGTKSFYAYSIR